MGDYEKCRICRTIPASSSYFIVGGETKHDDMPRSASQLEIVGAPFFKDSLSSSRTLIKLCPKCGTYYEWDYDYEFLVGGSEDDVTLTRLSDEEGRRRAEQMLDKVETARESYRDKARKAIRSMRHETNPTKLIQAIDVFETYTQLVQGFDIAFAIPHLIRCLSRLQAIDGYEGPIRAINTVFLLAVDNPEWCHVMIEALNETGNTSEEAKTIRRRAMGTLRRNRRR